jgi:porin
VWAKDRVRANRTIILIAVLLAFALARPGHCATVTDEFGRPITSWMLPPSTIPTWGLLDPQRTRGSGPTLQNADSLTGDWSGYRSRLSDDYGISLVGDYTSESAGNPIGGRRQGITYTHNIGLSLFADLDKLLGLDETVFLVSGSDRAGNSLSAQYIGNVYAVQQIFGGETIRLVQLALARGFFDRTLRVVAGRINGLDDFIASPLYCNAQNLAFCGNPLSIPSDVNISSYPNTMWGTRARWEPSEIWYAMGGVYNAISGFRANRFHGVDFSIRHNSGVIGVIEGGVMPEQMGLMPQELPGHIKLGGYYDTEPLTDFHSESLKRGTWGMYVAVDQKIYTEPQGGVQGLTLFAAYHYAPPDVNQQTNFVDLGAVYVGLIPTRDDDVAGFFFAYGWFSGDLRQAQIAAGAPGQDHEAVLELNYRWNALPWFYLQPDVQGILNPGAAHQFGDALVLAVQFGVPF